MALVTPNQPIHPSFDERISVKVEGQLPQFVKEDHATFVAFLEAQYEYMEQQGKPYEIIGNLDMDMLIKLKINSLKANR